MTHARKACYIICMNYDNWKTTPDEPSFWHRYAEQTSLGQMRADLVKWGILETFTQKTDLDIEQVWVEEMESRDYE